MSQAIKLPHPFARQFPRFRVANFKQIEAVIDRHRNNEQLVMIGNGGAGFYGFDKGFPTKYPHRVFCKFHLKGDDFQSFAPIVAQGNVIYSTTITLGNIKVHFHGVEFLPSERDKVRPLIQVLEGLYEKKIIDLT
jgi:hypothetical protein